MGRRHWVVVLALAACGDHAPSRGLDAHEPVGVDADQTAPTVTLLAQPSEFALLTKQTIAWSTDEAGTWQVMLGDVIVATGTANPGATISYEVIGAQLSPSAPVPIHVEVMDGAENVGNSPGTSLVLRPPVLIPNSTQESFEIIASSDGKRVYAALYYVGKVLVIDADPASASHETVLAEITVGSQPEGLALSPDGSRLYVGQDNGIAVIATATNTIATTINLTGHFAGMAVGTGHRLYATTNVSAIQVIDIDPASAQFHKAITSFPRQLLKGGRWAVTSDGKRGVLAWWGLIAYSVEILDLDPASASYGSALSTPVPVIAGPAPGPGVALSAGGVAYTAVLVNSATPLGTIDVASGAIGSSYGGLFDEQGSVGLASGHVLHGGLSSNALEVIRASDLTLVGSLPLAMQDEDLGRFIAITPDGARAYVRAPAGHFMIPLR